MRRIKKRKSALNTTKRKNLGFTPVRRAKKTKKKNNIVTNIGSTSFDEESVKASNGAVQVLVVEEVDEEDEEDELIDEDDVVDELRMGGSDKVATQMWEEEETHTTSKIRGWHYE